MAMSPKERSPPQRPPDVTDEQLIEAVRAACERPNLPVASTGSVADIEWVTIDQDSVKRRLDEIEEESGEVTGFDTGGAFVWWVPDEDEDRGTIDPSTIYWQNVDPEDIPTEIIDQHPEFSIPSRAEKLKQTGSTVIGPASITLIFGTGILFVQEYTDELVSQGSELELVGILAFLGGIIFVFIGIAIALIGKAGMMVEGHPLTEKVNRRTNQLLAEISDRIPISWDRNE